MKEVKIWRYTVYYTGRPNRVTNRVASWNSKIVLLKILHYTDDYTGRVDRVANRVLAWKFQNCIFVENWHYTVCYTGNLNRVSPRVVIWNFRMEIWLKCCITRLITRDNPNRVQSRVFALEGPNGLHGQTHGLYKPCLCLEFEHNPYLRSITWWE